MLFRLISTTLKVVHLPFRSITPTYTNRSKELENLLMNWKEKVTFIRVISSKKILF